MRSGFFRKATSTTRARLLLLVAAVLIPSTLFAVVMVLKFSSAEQARYRATTEAAAQQISASVDREVMGLITALQALANAPNVEPGADPSTLPVPALGVQQTRTAWLSLRDRNGVELFGPASQPRGQKLADVAAARAIDQAMFDTGDSTVSGLLEAAGGSKLIQIDVPVRRRGTVKYALALTFEPAFLDAMLARVAEPGWTLAIVDRNDRIVADSRANSAFIGRRVTADLQAAAQGQTGTWRGTTLEGIPVLGAYARSTLSGWRVAVGVRLSQLEAPLRQLLVAVAGSGLVIGVLALLLALQMARNISLPIAQLTLAADRLGRGEKVPRLHTGLQEADDVAGALAQAEEIITTRETALLASEERFRAAVRAVDGVIWTNDRSGRMTGDQSGWAALTGQSYEEYQGFGWAAAVHPDDAKATLQAWNEAVEQRKTFVFEHRLRRADGLYRRFSVRAVPVFGADGEVDEWVGVHTDITEEFAAKAALAAHEVKLRDLNATLERRVQETSAERDRIWRISTELMLIARFDGTVVALNPAWAHTLGWSEDELRGTSLLALVHPDDLAGMGKAGDASRRFGEPRFEQRYRHRDGSYRWLSWTAVTEAGLIHAIARDITAEKESQAALQRAEAQLRQSQKMEVVGQLTGGVAHDFNNLLTVVTGNLEMAQRRIDEAADPRLQRNVAAAAEGAQRAAVLTHRLLAFARQTPLRPETVDLNGVITDMADLIRRTLGEMIQIETQLDPALWAVEADRNQIENAVLNLCVNARDAMPKGGTLRIASANRTVDRPLASGDKGELAPGAYATIGVSDTGCGIEPAILDRVFEPFFTTKPVGKGTGLGLSQVFGFMRQSGGLATMASALGAGTTVQLFFPRQTRPPEPAVAPVEPTSAPPEGGGGQTCLVIEDEDMVREFSVAALQEAGYRVVEAGDGPTGLELLDRHPEIALLFTDLVLAGPLDGRAVADEAHRRRPHLRLLFTTGYTPDAVVLEGRLDAGIEILTKPFTATELVDKIRAVLKPAVTGTAHSTERSSG